MDEASPDDLEFSGGVFRVAGSPDREMPLAAIAFEAFTNHNLPDGMEPNLEHHTHYDPPNFSWPFGTHMCAVEVDTNSYSVPWRLIGERVAVTVAAGEVRIRHGSREVAVHAQAQGRRQRVIDRAHLDGVAGRDGAVRQRVIEQPPIDQPPPPPALLRPLAEYEAITGGRF